MNNPITDFLLEQTNFARITFEDKWMIVTDDAHKEVCPVFVVYQRRRGTRRTVTLYEGYHLSTAIAWLKGELTLD